MFLGISGAVNQYVKAYRSETQIRSYFIEVFLSLQFIYSESLDFQAFKFQAQKLLIS